MTIRTLHIDIEGGYGGSSRSLFELISRIDKTTITPVVACRQPGPAVKWYETIGVSTFVIPEIASFVPRNTAYFRNFAATLPRFLKLRGATRKLGEVITANKIDLIHYNYEGLFVLAKLLRRQFGLPAIAHSRAMIGNNVLGRLLAKELGESVDHIFCISPNEFDRWNLLTSSSPTNREIMWNIARPPQPRLPLNKPPEAIYLGSIDHTKGTDRLVDIAEALTAANAPPLNIAVYGSPRNRGQFHDALKTRVAKSSANDRIRLAGYCSDPMQAMASALALIRPSRDNDPWGRDVIEAAAAGLPAIATGSYPGVIVDGKTGWLIEPFDAPQIAKRLCELVQDDGQFEEMSRSATEHASIAFSGNAQAHRFVDVVKSLTA